LSTRRGTSTFATRLAAARRADRHGRYDEATRVLDAIIASPDDGSEPADRLDALALRSALSRYAGDLQRSMELIAIARAFGARLGVDAGSPAGIGLDAEAGLVLLESGEPEAADRIVAGAVRRARRSAATAGRDLVLARCLSAHGTVARVRGRYADAQRMLREAIHVVGAWTSPQTADADPDGAEDRAFLLAHLHGELGVLHKFRGDIEASRSSYATARALLLDAAGPDHPDHGTIEHNLGGLEHSAGNHDAALLHASRSVEIHAANLGDDHLATILDRSALAAILDALGRGAEATRMLRDCLERLERTVGPHHRETAVVHNNLGAIAQREGRLHDAERHLRLAAHAKRRSAGSDAPSLAITLNNLGTVTRRLGRPAAAVGLFEEALRIVIEAAGEEHVHVGTIRRNLERARRHLDGRQDDNRGVAPSAPPGPGDG
jgi:tetratricopeptide (TPR) repeat protein